MQAYIYKDCRSEVRGTVKLFFYNVVEYAIYYFFSKGTRKNPTIPKAAYNKLCVSLLRIKALKNLVPRHFFYLYFFSECICG